MPSLLFSYHNFIQILMFAYLDQEMDGAGFQRSNLTAVELFSVL